jgi:hypothetical protein
MASGNLKNPFGLNMAELELNISVDCVLFTVINDKLQVLLTRFSPDFGYALPGGFVRKKEDTDHAANRILFERTGVNYIYLKQFKVFSDPKRFSFEPMIERINQQDAMQVNVNQLPERVISVGYFALVNYESIHPTGGEFSEDSSWMDTEELPDLIFDHAAIIAEAAEALRRELYFKPVLYNLLPERFTMPELQNLYEIILGKSLDRGSFQRKMIRWDIFERLQERRTGVAHKQPFLYRFNKEKYELAVEQGIRFVL